MDDPRRGALDVTFRNLVARHQLKVVSGAMLLAVVLGIFIVTRDDVPPPPRPPRVELPVDAGPPAMPAFEVLAKIEEQPVTTKKGRLLKDQMKKRLEKGGGSKGGSTSNTSSGSSTKVATGNTVDVALAGDGELRRVLQKKLRGVRVVDEGAGTGRWLASLSMTTGEAKGGVIFAKCSAAMSELPQRKLVGSLASRADVSGDGSDDDELRVAAKSSCADALAEDVAQWVKARR